MPEKPRGFLAYRYLVHTTPVLFRTTKTSQSEISKKSLLPFPLVFILHNKCCHECCQLLYIKTCTIFMPPFVLYLNLTLLPQMPPSNCKYMYSVINCICIYQQRGHSMSYIYTYILKQGSLQG